VLARDGLVAVGINAIAKQAAVDKVLIYRYFGGLPELLRTWGASGRFWPREPVARVAVLEWLMFQMSSFGPIPGQVHHFVGLEDHTDRRYGLDRFMTETRRLYGVMDRRLAEREFFADALSIADFAILGWVWRHPRHQVNLADFPHVQRWYQSLMARPGVVRGFAVPLRHKA